MPTTCFDCCRESHLRTPLHRIHQWTGKYFIPSWLWKVGLCIDLGHGGQPCPCYHEGGVFPEPLSSEIPDEEDEPEDHGGIDNGKPTATNIAGAKLTVIVHTNGIHYLPVRICRCLDGPPEDIQMMRLGYYPSTYKYIRTMFTFQVLDDYLLANLECHTSGHHYYQKLRRMTNKAAPQLVPVGPLVSKLVHCAYSDSEQISGATPGEPTMAKPEGMEVVWFRSPRSHSPCRGIGSILSCLSSAWRKFIGELER